MIGLARKWCAQRMSLSKNLDKPRTSVIRRELNINSKFNYRDHKEQLWVFSSFGFATIACLLAVSSTLHNVSSSDGDVNNKDMLISNTSCDGCTKKYSSVIIGGGTAGCTVAYLTAKWMKENNIPGKVLLIDKGEHFLSPHGGPNPVMSAWFENWGSFGEAHPSVREDGSAYPVTGSDHKGVGGCGTHDTRITFQPTSVTMRRLADMMGWSEERINAYYQAALNLMPITPSIPAAEPEPFYQAMMDNLPEEMVKVPNNNHATRITVNSLAMSALAAYPNELRWTSAYLLHDSVRPDNLEVLCNASVDKILFEKNSGNVKAQRVLIQVGEGVAAQPVVVTLEDGGDVAVTGGAFGAVGVLQRSGIGPKAVLEAAGVEEVVVDSPELGHGADHPEIAVLYEWLDKWNDPTTGAPPRGGVMGWPLIAFLSFLPEHRDLFATSIEPLSAFMMGHVGAGFCEPYTDIPTVVCTPNCIRPDLNTGFRAQITSTRLGDSLHVVQAEQDMDYQAIAQGVLSTVQMMEHLRAQGVVGRRLQPSFEPSATNVGILTEWIRDNHFTAFHWASTCQAGVLGRVADHRFRVRNGPGVVHNLLVGSAAALPELPDANLHLTVTAFAFALAEEMVLSQADRRNLPYKVPLELRRAQRDLRLAAVHRTTHPEVASAPYLQQHTDSLLRVRRPGEEYPDLSRVASEHFAAWKAAHPNDTDL